MEKKYIIAIAILVAAVLILILAVVLFRKYRKPDVGKIYQTTDGFLASNPINKKKRHVAVVDQRDDQAVAVVKIYSKKGKDGNHCIQKVVLKPEKHKSLTEDSLVGQRVIIGIKNKDGYQAINTRDLNSTGDKLTKIEYQKIKKELGGPERKNHKSTKKKLKQWQNHFGNKK